MPRPDIIDPLGNFGLFTIWAPNGANDHRPYPSCSSGKIHRNKR